VDIYQLSDLGAQRGRTGQLYLEFLRVDTLSAGLYELPAGGIDPQQPHTEDEIYHVVAGRATIRVGDENQEVRAGSVIFVAAGVEHRFHTITEDLTILVIFAPAEYTHGAPG
jgi:quercetin dioxygenase-like cupin family protein